ncbi:MAG: transcription antitermination factor NusB [Culturomica sp.]|jgi:N utilization substance protein B|nr:transcription antitermination factor NusB [Culturomica sp.]
MLYANSKREGYSLAETERDLLKSIDKSTDLYFYIILLLTELHHKAFQRMDAAKHKYITTEADLHPNTRFIDNPVFALLNANKQFKSYLLNHKISWNNHPELITYLYKKMVDSPGYTEYLQREHADFKEHKQFVIKLFTGLIAQEELFFQTLEDLNIYWNDDFEIVLNLVYKTLSGLKEENTENDRIFYSVYNPEEDIDFAGTLLRRTLLENTENVELIERYIVNWEIDRISEMDRLIMSAALSELKNFPSIPVKVSLDEYIEISKTYSSPKSSGFINGVLDRSIAELIEKGRIQKTGRGLVEQ